jgi:hypothetical protein
MGLSFEWSRIDRGCNENRSIMKILVHNLQTYDMPTSIIPTSIPSCISRLSSGNSSSTCSSSVFSSCAAILDDFLGRDLVMMMMMMINHFILCVSKAEHNTSPTGGAISSEIDLFCASRYANREG